MASLAGIRAGAIESPAALDLPPAIEAPYRLARPIRVGSINNPLSWRNAQKAEISPVLEVLRGHAQVPHFEVEGYEQMDAAVRALVAADTELIVVNGGDGTVQGVLTALLRDPPPRMPLLAVLPGGTTNMTAGDVGAGTKTVPALQQLLAEAAEGRVAGHVVRRDIIRVDIGPGLAPQFGMFFGAGAVYYGITFCKRELHARGLRGELGPGLAVAILIGRVATGTAGTIIPPMRLSGLVDGRPLVTDDYVALFISTLTRLFVGLRPFWAQGPGPIRFTTIRSRVSHILPAASAIVRGKSNRYVKPEFGYTSHNAQEIELDIDSGFTIDGELFDAQPGRPLRLSGGACAYFVSRKGT